MTVTMTADDLMPAYVLKLMGEVRMEEIREQFVEDRLPPVVGITGRKRHGKNTAAEGLRSLGYDVWGFADEVKAAALDLDPIVVAHSATRLSTIVAGWGGWERAKEIPEVRYILQMLGTEVVRSRSPYFWVESLDSRWDWAGMPLVVVADVRFDNEAEWVRTQGGMTICVERPSLGDDGDTHESEAGISEDLVDAWICNDGTEHDLHVATLKAVLRFSHTNKETQQ